MVVAVFWLKQEGTQRQHAAIAHMNEYMEMDAAHMEWQEEDKKRCEEEWEKLIDEEEDKLIDDFPQYQDDLCIALMENVDDIDPPDERKIARLKAPHLYHIDLPECELACLKKKRRIMEEANHLLEAWMSADFLKKMFRREEVPRHFQKVIDFLEK